MSARQRTAETKTPEEILEDIVTRKKSKLLEEPATPKRIRSLLEQKRDPKCTTEIIAHIVFPDSKNSKSRGFLLSALCSSSLKDKEHSRLKSEVQKVEHLTDHTRITLLNVLDELRK